MPPRISGEHGHPALQAPLLACVLVLLVAGAARPGERREARDASSGEARAKSAPERVAREPVCRVKVADKKGFVMSGLLLAFEDGVYHVRGPDDKDIELREGDVSSVRFSPLKELEPKIAKPRGPKPKHPGRPEGRDYRPRPGLERKGGEFLGKVFRELADRREQQWQRLNALKAQGQLDDHVRRLSASLVNARTTAQAVKILAEINMARNVKEDPLTPEDLRRLVDAIADRNVRDQTAEPARRLLRPRGPQPHGPGEWWGPGRRRPVP